MRRRLLIDLLVDGRAAAAVEMVLIAPLMLILMLGSSELGNYFMNEHSLVKAVRDGARFAARQSFAYYPNCSGSPDDTNVVQPTKSVVMYGYLSGTSVLTPNITTGDITVSTQCFGAAGGQMMTGLYKIQPNGAQIVTVSADVTYRPILATFFGFSGADMHLNADSQAAVTGL